MPCTKSEGNAIQLKMTSLSFKYNSISNTATVQENNQSLLGLLKYHG